MAASLCGIGILVVGSSLLLCATTSGLVQQVAIGVAIGSLVGTVFCGIQSCIGQPKPPGLPGQR